MYDAMMWLRVFVFKKVHHDESFSHFESRICNYLVYFLYIKKASPLSNEPGVQRVQRSNMLEG